MAEQGKKIYISAREFIDSWEKEVYQLSNLDLFTYQLINELASAIEGNYFKNKKAAEDSFYLYSEEIGSLCFDMADSLQLFFEKNCLGSCKLKCPIELNKKITNTDWTPPSNFLQLSVLPSSNYNKEQCLYYDMLNYVILDSLIDFYHYEMDIVLTEDDERIMHFAEFIAKVILNFIRNKGQTFLNNPWENATQTFNELLQTDDSEWHDMAFTDEMEEDDTESWKINQDNIELVLNEFLVNYQANHDHETDLMIISKLKDYFSDFLEIDKIEEITLEDLGEFLTVVFPNDMIFHNTYDIQEAHLILLKYIEFLEYHYPSELTQKFLEYDRLVFEDVIRTIGIVQKYNENHSYVSHLLTANKNEESLAEGFMRIKSLKHQRYELEDIHLNTHFENIELADLDANSLSEGDILHIQLSLNDNTWQLSHLEMVYSAYASYYLF